MSLYTTPTTPYIGNYLPFAKIGFTNFIYVYEYNNINWYGVSSIYDLGPNGGIYSNATIPVLHAYKIDSKVDDGLPSTGNVQAVFLNGSYSVPPGAAPNTTVAGGNSTSCYDTSTGTYSITVSGGANANCALSFKFQ